MLQRYFKIGFNRAARIMDQLADAGVVGPEEGTKPRKVLMTLEEFEEYLKKYLMIKHLNKRGTWNLKSDIEIAQEAEMLQITEVAKKLDIEAMILNYTEKYKAKLSDELLQKCKEQ